MLSLRCGIVNCELSSFRHSAKPFSDLRKERDIAQLQQDMRSLQDELHMEHSRRQLAEG